MKDQPLEGEVSAKAVFSKVTMDNDMSLKRSFNQFNMYQFKLGQSANVEQVVNDLMLNPNVDYAEPNYIFEKQSLGIEGQPMSLSEMDSEMEAEIAGQSSFLPGRFRLTYADINADEAWQALSNTSRRPIVAVLDSGVDYNHYVFVDSSAIWSNPGEIPGNGVDDDGNGYVDDIRGWNFVANNNNPMDNDNHGTHVAGIVLGMTQNILASDIQPSMIQIMPLKMLNKRGLGSTSTALAAINYALNNGADVLNNSWGGGAYSQALHDALATAYKRKKTFIAASGNSNNNNDSKPLYPASYNIPNVVSIAATTSSDRLASFSNYGTNSVHVASPGVSIRSTLPNNSFGYSSGTSMAAPFASGLAALMIREKGQINGYQVKSILYEYSLRLNGLAGKVASQSRIDAFEALQFVQKNTIEDYQPEYSGRGLAGAEGAAGGGCGILAKVLHERSSRGGRRPSSGKTMLFLGLLFAPAILMNILRMRKQKLIESRRQFPRYKMDSEVRIQVGEKELVGQMNSISVGGARIDTDALLEKGGIVTLNIASPEGDRQLQVEGRVVWSEEKKVYGVEFCNTRDTATQTIGGWAKKLGKARS